MLGAMAIAAGTHFGPWSEEDLVGLPDEARGYELLEGTLLVNPPPGGAHQAVSWMLTGLLRAAAGPDLMVVQELGVRLPDNTMFIPDVLVANREVVLANTSGILDPTDVTLVAEIVSPGSRIMDRLAKPAAYAAAGIPSFWRVELKNGPVIFAYSLEEGRYVEVGAARSGERLTVNEPFPVSIDPADLQP
jgi:Uma2 family endonuclease